MPRTSVTLLLLLLPAALLRAQAPAADCAYERCALRISPRLTGLALVSNERDEVANLNFFWPRDIEIVFRAGSRSAGNDSALAYASHALRARKVAAAFTNGGLIMAGAALASAVGQRKVRPASMIFAVAGTGAFAVSIPLQFNADDLLGKAVWWYNRRFAP